MLFLCEILGQTAEGRNIDLLVIGETDAKKIKNLDHCTTTPPGETMAEWFMEGLIHRLLDSQGCNQQ